MALASRFSARIARTMSPALCAVAQITSTAAVADNLSACLSLTAQAAARGAQMIFFPEATDFIGQSKEQTLELTESLEGNFVSTLKKAAQEHNIFISVGVHEKSKDDAKRIFNSHLVIDRGGTLVGLYRKIHLFDVDIADGPKLLESASTIPGSEVVAPVTTPIGRVGLSVCYDLRFPEQSLLLRRMGAQILTYPSAFTVKTGLAHWEILLRARAIETQSFVVAAAQTGWHNAKRESFGHAMIVDPWGTIVAQCGEQSQQLGFAEIDLGSLDKIRTEMPVENHRRSDVYRLDLV
ncbi:nitrilase and fragile histidine triad fusion protein NitFhit [Polychytrium aggregatum]|uniref:nitrilase and fragile histidine triad fusion protein NitFhit n=1 Tax=Polychytrium aggregatum TaxID=110093 RepID=UPI0022FEA174|nr:nitrilase and fragile histidine triad fusion protein NitFhit [Polychytrium aggregatum]KAI9197251.1 nitrilase and fragile histidine triad fusion protein NitFhit [Polychytrium aggregatum]